MAKIILGLFIGFWVGGWSFFLAKCEPGDIGFGTHLTFVSLLVVPAVLGYLIGKNHD